MDIIEQEMNGLLALGVMHEREVRAALERVATPYETLIPSFLQAMNEIGQYGHAKYNVQSFQHRRLLGDHSRNGMERNQAEIISLHASEHFDDYLIGIKHDHFNTRRHQLAAVAFNAMMEYFYAGLEDEK